MGTEQDSTSSQMDVDNDADASTDAMDRQQNGTKIQGPDNSGESELSEPDSNILNNEMEEEEIVVRGRRRHILQDSPGNSEDHADQDESEGSHYPKRKRTSIFNDLSETKLENGKTSPEEETESPTSATRPNRQAYGNPGVKGVLLGHWRDSSVPEDSRKHAVVGFIDVRDRLRTRIQPNTKEGELLLEQYPLPPGPGGSWVTFERVVFSDHLVGLDHFQIKEYTRLRSEVPFEDTVEDRVAGETAAVKEAIRRVKENPALDNPAQPPAVAYGVAMPENLVGRPDLKRRRISSGFANSHPVPLEMAPDYRLPTPQQSIAAHQGRFSIDPLPGTRPTRILIGHWKPSSEPDPKDRHAVYGILGQNDMFRVKVVRETRDGRFVDGNFPSGAGALWIPYEEVEFEPHLKLLNRAEVKEYCRVRQHQLDRGETSAERIDNETKAVYEAQTRAGHMPYKAMHNATVPTFSASPQGGDANGYRRPDQRPLRASFSDNMHGPMERANALARREIARAEAAQGRADRHAYFRERPADPVPAANMGMDTSYPHHQGRAMFHESEDMQRLNKVWARQEMSRAKPSEDVKFYDGQKYERKPHGPLAGKLVSQGTIINIDGEDYVEYRVLTKPSFF